MRVGRLALAGAGLTGFATAGWFVLARVQGDSEMGYGPCTVIAATEGLVHAEIEVVNRGREPGVIRRIEGHHVEGPHGRVLVTLKDSHPPQRGWWVSNILHPGERCVAEVDVELDENSSQPVVLELVITEIGRRLQVHRRTRLTLPTGPLPA